MEKNSTAVTKTQIAEQYRYMELVRNLFAGREKFVFMQTFGCQQNEADSERLCGMAELMGYTVTDDPDQADLIIVNTCAVREHAELKTLSIAGQYKHIKEKNPDLIIGICGCMVSQEHRTLDIKNKYPYIDFLFGTYDNYRFPEILYQTLTSGKRILLGNEGDASIAEGLPVHRFSSFKAWVSIMYGCNNFCTYCIVPYVRGRERSRRRDDILAEIEALAASGYREITLLGQNVNSYGRDTSDGGKYDFADLLSDVCAVPGDFIVRFMTSHPKDVSKKLIETIAANHKIARQFHLPLQSGSDQVLRAMNRGYTFGDYYSTVSFLREKIPDISISTDIIVGFPGETEAEFEETLSALKLIQFDSLYSFIYSPRKGTRASKMDCQIDDSIKKERFSRLLDLQNQISYEKNLAYEGKIIEVLVEGISKTDKTKLTGRNERNRLVHFEGPVSLTGEKVNIYIDKAETYALYGHICD